MVLSINFQVNLSQFTINYNLAIIPLVTKLWKEVFLYSQFYYIKDKTLYDQIKTVLEKAREDL